MSGVPDVDITIPPHAGEVMVLAEHIGGGERATFADPGSFLAERRAIADEKWILDHWPVSTFAANKKSATTRSVVAPLIGALT